MTTPVHDTTVAMADRVARALNLLGTDWDLCDSPDSDALLELLDDYLDDSVDSEGKPAPSLVCK